jgi:hypothetical protein
LETCPADFIFMSALAGFHVDADFERKSLLQAFIFLSPAPESRSADFPFAQHPFGCFHSGSDVLVEHSFTRLFCQPTWLPPDPSEPVCRFYRHVPPLRAVHLDGDVEKN